MRPQQTADSSNSILETKLQIAVPSEYHHCLRSCSETRHRMGWVKRDYKGTFRATRCAVALLCWDAAEGLWVPSSRGRRLSDLLCRPTMVLRRRLTKPLFRALEPQLLTSLTKMTQGFQNSLMLFRSSNLF